MKRNLLVIATVVVSAIFSSNASGQWVNTNTQNIYIISDIGFFKSKTGIFLAFSNDDARDVRRTTDGGKTWARVDLDKFNLEIFYALSTVNTTIGYAGGRHLIKTTDAGATWDSVQNMVVTGLSRDDVNFSQMVFPTEMVGYALIGTSTHTIYKTTDGGATWNSSVNISGADIKSFYALDANNIYAINGYSKVEYTNDGGTNWKTYQSSNFGTTSIYSVLFMDANNGFVTGDNANLFKTTDGGATWTEKTLDVSVSLTGIQFLDANNGIISGTREMNFFTKDGGATWNHSYINDPNAIFLYDLKKAYYFDNANGVALGSSGVFEAILVNSAVNTGIKNSTVNTIDLNIYPNPSTGIINIRTNGAEEKGLVTVFDNEGKIVFSKNMEDNYSTGVSVSGLNKGIYVIEMTTKTGNGHQQVIVE